MWHTDPPCATALRPKGGSETAWQPVNLGNCLIPGRRVSSSRRTPSNLMTISRRPASVDLIPLPPHVTDLPSPQGHLIPRWRRVPIPERSVLARTHCQGCRAPSGLRCPGPCLQATPVFTQLDPCKLPLRPPLPTQCEGRDRPFFTCLPSAWHTVFHTGHAQCTFVKGRKSSTSMDQKNKKPQRPTVSDRKSTRLNSSHEIPSRMPSSA